VEAEDEEERAEAKPPDEPEAAGTDEAWDNATPDDAPTGLMPLTIVFTFEFETTETRKTIS
jgi:hypothetical protein